MSTQTRVPVTIVTGFLGSGKTTMVNHILRHQTGLEIGVVVNEFGELGIDGSLITQIDGVDIVELSNGCVCCASRGDLEAALSALASSGRRFDHILLESSGLADPGPVMDRLGAPPLSENLRLHQTVTLVDAANFDRNLEHAEAAYNQITHADVLVLNKADLVDAEVINQIREGLATLNASARLVTTSHASVSFTELLADLTGESTLAPTEKNSLRTAGYSATHSQDWMSVSIPCATPVDEQQFRQWIQELPDTVVRTKGVLRLDSVEGVRPVAIHSVFDEITVEPIHQEITDGKLGMVVIGSALDEATIKDGLMGCVSISGRSTASSKA